MEPLPHPWFYQCPDGHTVAKYGGPRMPGVTAPAEAIACEYKTEDDGKACALLATLADRS
jgi:hypothetical protein